MGGGGCVCVHFFLGPSFRLLTNGIHKWIFFFLDYNDYDFGKSTLSCTSTSSTGSDVYVNTCLGAGTDSQILESIRQQMDDAFSYTGLGLINQTGRQAGRW